MSETIVRKIRVACRCGWEGTQDQLLGQRFVGEDRYCPECKAAFKSMRPQSPKADD